jgi:capsular exopolysaccharide synthesis family protein
MAQYDVTLRNYWRILRRRRSIVLFTACSLSLFSFLLAQHYKPALIYKAQAKVQINPSVNASLAAMYGFAGGTDEIETQRAIITSYKVMESVGERLNFFKDAKTEEDTARIVLSMPSTVDTDQDGHTSIITIKTVAASAELARDMANTIADVFSEYDHGLKNEKNVKQREFVEAARDSARSKLEEAEEEVRRYREETHLISLNAQTNVTLSQITQLERLVEKAKADLSGIKKMLSEMESDEGISDDFMKGASEARVGETFMAQSRKLEEERLQRESLLVKYTEEHPSVKRVDVTIVQLTKNQREELRRRRDTIAGDLAGEELRLKKLRADYGQLPTSGLALGRLEREVELRQNVMMSLEEQYQMALAREAGVAKEVTILQRAITPTNPSNINSSANRAMMGFVLGLFLGVIFAVLVEMLDTSIGTIEDVREYIGTQVVGVIPYIDAEQVRESLEKRGLATGTEETVARKAQLVYFFDPQSTLAETYRTLRTNIEFATVEKNVKMIMVTSSSFGEGKSTVIANLAMSIAQLGKRTLLVDADLRKPTLARMFGLEREPGLTEVIIGNNRWQEVVRTLTDIVTGSMGLEGILQTQGISNLHIMPSGSIPPNPAELLNSKNTSEFIEEVREAYDMVLFDTPPVLQVTDAAILGKKLGVTVLVYKAGDIPRTSLKRSADLLRSMEIDLLGIALNGISSEMGADYEDYGYHSYYAYGTPEKVTAANLVLRLEDYITRFRDKSSSKGGAQAKAIEELTKPTVRRQSNRDRTNGDRPNRRASAVSYLMMLVVGIGFIWQSGYLHRSFGAIPLLQRYQAVADHESRDDETGSSGSAGTASGVPTAIGAFRSQAPPAAGDVVGAGKSASASIRAPVREAKRGRGPVAPLPVTPVDLDRGRTGQPYSIRTASYDPSSNWALASLRRLRQGGEMAFLSPVVVRGRTLERLLIGSFASGDAALKHARRLLEEGKIEEFAVLRLPYTMDLQTIIGRDQAQMGVEDSLPGGGAFAYAQDLGDGSYRLLIGAFATEAEARRYAEITGGGKVAIR